MWPKAPPPTGINKLRMEQGKTRLSDKQQQTVNFSAVHGYFPCCWISFPFSISFANFNFSTQFHAKYWKIPGSSHDFQLFTLCKKFKKTSSLCTTYKMSWRFSLVLWKKQGRIKHTFFREVEKLEFWPKYLHVILDEKFVTPLKQVLHLNTARN